MAKKVKKLVLKDALEKIRESLPQLPTAEETQAALQTITEIMNDLDTLRGHLARFPGEREVDQVSQAIHTISSFFDSVKDRPLLAEALFTTTTKARKPKKEASPDVDGLMQLLEGLPTGSIVAELSKQKKDTLVALSAKLGISATSKLTKDALVDKIFKLGFANRRGYELLGGEKGGA
ncbi:MAG: hypothetical protein HW390_3216 [Candidatus Brocadiaceae bacterium]|nr:hypothetical protein [Candidatus Brocadiaceae bacterium]